MDEATVRRVLRRAGLAATRISAIEGGWANWTFDLDGALIVRFPRTDAVAMATHRELSLLPALADAVSFEVPRPLHVGTWNDRPFFAYRRIDGTPLVARGADAEGAAPIAAALGEVIEELHRFPVDRAAHLLRLGRPETCWHDRLEDLWAVVEDVALPELDDDLAEEVRRHYGRMLDDPPEFEPTLIHNDLGPEHVLVRSGADPSIALIDFEDASVGDPAIDLTWPILDLGIEHARSLVRDRDLGDRLPERLWFYRWMGSVHAVIYGVTAEVDEERVGGAIETRRRMAMPPPDLG